MEQEPDERNEDINCDGRMGGEEMVDGDRLLMEEDVGVELCEEAGLEMSTAEPMSQNSDECLEREEVDWLDSVISCKMRSSVREDGENQTQERKDDPGSVQIDDQTERSKETGRTLDVCLWPVEENWAHVKISMEEVETYYRFSRCCHWLCGRCQSCSVFYFPYFTSLCSSLSLSFTVIYLFL